MRGSIGSVDILYRVLEIQAETAPWVHFRQPHPPGNCQSVLMFSQGLPIVSCWVRPRQQALPRSPPQVLSLTLPSQPGQLWPHIWGYRGSL